MPEIETIGKELINSYYAHCDESQIKVNGITIVKYAQVIISI